MIGAATERLSLPQLCAALALTVGAVTAWAHVIGGPVERLEAARAERARLAAVMTTERPPQPALLPPGQMIVAASATEAVAVLSRRLEQEGRARGLLVEQLKALPPQSRVRTRAAITLSGPEPAVMAYLQSVESGGTLIRFARWRIAATGTAGAVRFEGEAQAMWRTAP